MIIDCFPFFNELDVLEVRLNALAPYVDMFVLNESPISHSGQPKPLFFQENKDRFKDFNIKHLIRQPSQIGDVGGSLSDAWRREHADREHLMEGIRDLDPETIIFLSDVDEIPDLSQYKLGTEGAFKQKVYYYYFNCFSNQRHWKGTIVQKLKNIKTMNHTRNHRGRYPTIVVGGWHFSTLGNAEQVKHKIENVAHRELDTDEFKSMIEHNREHLIDPYGGFRPGLPDNWKENRSKINVKLTKEDPSGPEWLLKNRERYPDLWI